MRYIAAVVLAGVVAVSSGCSTVAKQALYAVTGASGRYFELKSVGSDTAMDKFKVVQVKDFKTDALLGTLPREIISLTTEQIIEQLEKPEKDMLLFEKVGRAAAQAVACHRWRVHRL
jgi:hypothetical protein